MRLFSAHRPQSTHDTRKAYRELSQEAFAAWIVLCAGGGHYTGRTAVAEYLSLSYRQSNELLRELLNKGYVDIEREGVAKKSIVKVRLAAMFERSALVVRV